MKTTATLTLICLLLGLVISAGANDQPSIYKVGATSRSFQPNGAYDWRGTKTHALITTVWYPAEANAVEKPINIGPPGSPLFTAGKAAVDAKLASSPSKFPLIVLSHGTGGSALMMGWLGTALASHGYIAAAVNHPGNNALETYTPQGFSLWWERAKDLSVVIDSMFADPMFANRIDPKRIGAAGFSLGGYTMIELVGGTTHMDQYEAHCKAAPKDAICDGPPEFPDLVDKVNQLAKTDPAFAAALQHADDSHRDPRVRAVFAIAPALGPAFSPTSLAKISVPVEILAGTADNIVPVDTSAKFFAAKISGARLTLIPGAAHYTFLAECTEQGLKAVPELCKDGAGVDRRAVHDEAIRKAEAFFDTKLK